MVSRATVESGCDWSLARHSSSAASTWLSIRDPGKSPSRIHSLVSRLPARQQPSPRRSAASAPVISAINLNSGSALGRIGPRPRIGNPASAQTRRGRPSRLRHFTHQMTVDSSGILASAGAA